jgi:acyl carrier protein
MDAPMTSNVTNPIPAAAPTREDVTSWLLQWISQELKLPADQIEPGKSLLDYSLSSLTATILVGDLEDWLGLRLPPTLVWDYPSITALVDHLMGQLCTRESIAAPASAAAAPAAALETTDLDALSDQEVRAMLGRLLADGSGAY